MLSAFRNNQSTTVFVLAFYVVLLRLPAMLGWVPPQVDVLETDGGLLFRDLFGRIVTNAQYSAIAATVLVFIQALSINTLVDKFRLLDNRNWYPGALYGLAASFLPEFLFITPTLVAATFIPFAFQNVFKVYKQIAAYGAIFNSAFWITVAALFHPPVVWCFPAIFFGLFNLRALSLRDQVVFLTGIIAPAFLALTGYFWFDEATTFYQLQVSQWFYFPVWPIASDFYANIKIALLGIVFLVTILNFNTYYFRRLIQVQKFITILYWFIFSAIFAAIFQPVMRFEYFFLAMPVVGIFLAYLGQSIRNNSLVDFLHLLLFAVVIYIQFYPQIF